MERFHLAVAVRQAVALELTNPETGPAALRAYTSSLFEAAAGALVEKHPEDLFCLRFTGVWVALWTCVHDLIQTAAAKHTEDPALRAAIKELVLPQLQE